MKCELCNTKSLQINDTMNCKLENRYIKLCNSCRNKYDAKVLSKCRSIIISNSMYNHMKLIWDTTKSF